MVDYTYVNVNPKGRETGDCATRALVGVLGIDYAEALKLQVEESLKCYYDPTSKQVMERVLKKYGYVKMKQPRRPDGKKYKVGEIDELVKDGRIFITIANHHTCVVNGVVQDTWDCRDKTIGNYYIKEEL